METGLEAGFETAIVGTADWPGLVVALSNQASLISLLVALMSCAALLWIELRTSRQPISGQTAPWPVGPVREGLTCAWLNSPSRTALALAGVDGVRRSSQGRLALAGELSPTDLLALDGLRRRVLSGQVAEEATPSQRVAFVRWLTEQGRIDG